MKVDLVGIDFMRVDLMGQTSLFLAAASLGLGTRIVTELTVLELRGCTMGAAAVR